MNINKIEYYKKKLFDWKKELLAEASSTVSDMQNDSATAADPNDRATLEEEFTILLRTRDRERKLIEKINKSLRLIELGRYGMCELCGVKISSKRLEARPIATLCTDCKEITEK